MKCPRCFIELHPVAYNGVNVYQCKRCAGYMVDQQKVIALKIPNDDVQPQEHPQAIDDLRCPRCHSEMDIRLLEMDGGKKLPSNHCRICSAIWFEPSAVSLMQLDFPNSRRAIDQLRVELLGKRQTVEISVPEQISEDTAPVDDDRVVLDIAWLVLVIFLSLLTLYFKLKASHLMAAFSFAVVTILACWGAFRFLEKRGKAKKIATALLAFCGVVLAILIWSW